MLVYSGPLVISDAYYQPKVCARGREGDGFFYPLKNTQRPRVRGTVLFGYVFVLARTAMHFHPGIIFVYCDDVKVFLPLFSLRSISCAFSGFLVRLSSSSQFVFWTGGCLMLHWS